MNTFKLIGRDERKVLMLSGLLGDRHGFDRPLAYAEAPLALMTAIEKALV